MAVCEKLRLCGEAAHHETNDGDEGGMRKGRNDDETEGETKAEYERTAENAQGQEREREKDEKKGGEGIAENRAEAGKEPAVMVVATSLGEWEVA